MCWSNHPLEHPYWTFTSSWHGHLFGVKGRRMACGPTPGWGDIPNPCRIPDSLPCYHWPQPEFWRFETHFSPPKLDVVMTQDVFVCIFLLLLLLFKVEVPFAVLSIFSEFENYTISFSWFTEEWKFQRSRWVQVGPKIYRIYPGSRRKWILKSSRSLPITWKDLRGICKTHSYSLPWMTFDPWYSSFYLPEFWKTPCLLLKWHECRCFPHSWKQKYRLAVVARQSWFLTWFHEF